MGGIQREGSCVISFMEGNGSTAEHVPVLDESLAGQVRMPADGVMVDVTVGHGGHSLLFGKTLGPAGTIVGFDVDTNVIRRARLRLENLACKVILIHSNFAEISDQVRKQGIEQVDFILADLGICSAQIADARKGLSFQSNMPLDMRIDKRIKRTAADIVNSADEKSLADLIYKFGQDRASRRIARFIAVQRRRGRIETTGELAAVVCKALGRPGGKRSRIHPATRTFQALRIAVNDELGNLEKLLISAPGLLKRNGYMAVISFHSLEDRLVKNNFRENEKADVYRIMTRKPIVASREEVLKNRRSRSAKLRIAQKQ